MMQKSNKTEKRKSFFLFLLFSLGPTAVLELWDLTLGDKISSTDLSQILWKYEQSFTGIALLATTVCPTS